MTSKVAIYILGIIPFIGGLGFLPAVNKVTPYVLGMPFLFFWMVLWTVLITCILGIIYKIDPANKEGDSE
ncbi:uncharacterized protein DUF3311 [Scopulibacillus darangshiensis]|uniref:Uncharacterized protein DUF3311 n=1 Tax=Scopulibacillus darangshiensis TaxID=442528 RepID=A0A4R2P7E3_9BACL|nr:DUF3311 domain-containing protein [Scopulibacillus darangshiensis]TCP30850.1 uncharacterized protein DUF3311 [Scopulibacillus darangshiensis]